MLKKKNLLGSTTTNSQEIIEVTSDYTHGVYQAYGACMGVDVDVGAPHYQGCLSKIPYWQDKDGNLCIIGLLYKFIRSPEEPTQATVYFQRMANIDRKLITVYSSFDKIKWNRDKFVITNGVNNTDTLGDLNLLVNKVFFKFDPPPDGYLDGVYTTFVDVHDGSKQINGGSYYVIFDDDTSTQPSPPDLQIWSDFRGMTVLVTRGRMPKYVVMVAAPSGYNTIHTPSKVDINNRTAEFILSNGTVLPEGNGSW